MGNDYMRYPTTVKMLAGEIKAVCDDYKKRKINNDDITEVVSWYAKMHSDKLFCNGKINPTVSKIIGQKRVQLLNVLLSEENGGIQ